ncbi:hypothetical protein NMG60_11016137 [Bertholletia excelsa]
MGTRKGSTVSSDRQKWQKVFNALVRMLQAQQAQIKSLAKERKLLEDRIRLLHDRSVSDYKLFQDQISQLKRDFEIQEMARNVEAAKSDLVVSLKQREAVAHKMKLDDAVDELADFRACFDHLSHECSENEEHSSERLALVSERNFVWNQYKIRETEHTDQLKTKIMEVEQANEKIRKLLTTTEQLHSSTCEKEIMILGLKNDMAELEATSTKKSEEISKLSRELELLRNARNDSSTPVLCHCSSKSHMKDRKQDSNVLKTESHPSRVLAKGAGSLGSKRKAVEVIPLSETPKLFTSSFKVPKLKNPCPCVI